MLGWNVDRLPLWLGDFSRTETPLWDPRCALRSSNRPATRGDLPRCLAKHPDLPKQARPASALIVADTDSPFVVIVTLPPCSKCGGPIPLARVVAAEGRGRKALFCCKRCQQNGTKGNSRAKSAGRIKLVHVIVGQTEEPRGRKLVPVPDRREGATLT